MPVRRPDCVERLGCACGDFRCYISGDFGSSRVDLDSWYALSSTFEYGLGDVGEYAGGAYREYDIEPALQLGCQHVELVGRQHLAEQHDRWPDDRLARRAVWWDLNPAVIVDF